jgi:hypothetical protein
MLLMCHQIAFALVESDRKAKEIRRRNGMKAIFSKSENNGNIEFFSKVLQINA